MRTVALNAAIAADAADADVEGTVCLPSFGYSHFPRFVGVYQRKRARKLSILIYQSCVQSGKGFAATKEWRWFVGSLVVVEGAAPPGTRPAAWISHPAALSAWRSTCCGFYTRSGSQRRSLKKSS